MSSAKMVAILSRERWVNTPRPHYSCYSSPPSLSANIIHHYSNMSLIFSTYSLFPRNLAKNFCKNLRSAAGKTGIFLGQCFGREGWWVSGATCRCCAHPVCGCWQVREITDQRSRGRVGRYCSNLVTAEPPCWSPPGVHLNIKVLLVFSYEAGFYHHSHNNELIQLHCYGYPV